MALESGLPVWDRKSEDCPHLRRVGHPREVFCLLAGSWDMSPVRRKTYREQICRTEQHKACGFFRDWETRGIRQRFCEWIERERRDEKRDSDEPLVTSLS